MGYGMVFVWLMVALIVLAVLVLLAAIVSHRFARLLCTRLIRALVRLNVYHSDQLRASSGRLIVVNATTTIDWLLLFVSVPRRFALIENELKTHRFVSWFARLGFVKSIQASEAPALLDAGGLVVMFPEGALTKNGQMLPFREDVESILNRCRSDVAIVPVYLDNLWGTWFSLKPCSWATCLFGLAVRRRVAIYFGDVLPKTATTSEIRAAVVECSARCGVAQSDFLRATPSAFIRQAASFKHLFRLAFVDYATGTERKLTWARTLVGVWSLHAWLRNHLRSECNVAIWLPTSLGSSLTNTALNLVGKTTVNLNYTCGPATIAACLRKAQVKQIITSRKFCERVPLDAPADIEVIYLETVMSQIPKRAQLLRYLAVLILPGWLLDRLVFQSQRIDLDSPQTILFSSGTTAEPKGVVLSYRNIAGNVDGFRRGVEFHDSDRMLVTLPFFHSFGYTVSMWACLVVGMEAVVFPDPRQAKELAELCKKHHCSILLATATFLRLYMKRAEVNDFRSLRLIVCGAEKLPVQLADEFFARFGVRPYEGYGCTETAPVVSVNLPDIIAANRVEQVANKPGTVGQPIPNVCVRTFDLDTTQMLPVGEEGLLGCLGSNVMRGYLDEPEKTLQVCRDGWFISGDVGWIDADGFIQITGRVSRFAKIAGEMIPLERLDETLHEIIFRTTGFCGERKLAVAAAPCERRGERIVLLYLEEIVEQLPSLMQELKKLGLPNLWIPDLRDSYPVASFPILGTGKLDLKRLGDQARELSCVQARSQALSS